VVFPVYGQSDINLNGAFDFHVHSGPDSIPRSIDADALAKLAKEKGMRGLVLKNHWESTAALAYMVHKQVPGIEIFGGIALNLSVGGVNLDAVKRMTMMEGGLGRVVWLPTHDAESAMKFAHDTGPSVSVSKDGHLLPEVLALIDFISQHHELVLETGHISAAEGLMVVHEAHLRGVKHIVVTHPLNLVVGMTVPQIQQAASEGAYIEFTYGSLLPPKPQCSAAQYADVIHKIGAKSSILDSDSGFPERPLHPQAMLAFMEEMHKAGVSVDDINIMTKVNPALILELKP